MFLSRLREATGLVEEFRPGRLVMVVRWSWVPLHCIDGPLLPWHQSITDGIGDGEASLVDGNGADGGNDDDGHLIDADVGGTGCSVDPW